MQRHHRRMTDSQIIVLATPLFLLLIAVEFAVGLARHRNTYVTADALNSIGLGIMSQVLNVFSKLLMVGVYALAFEALALHPLPQDAVWVWLVGLLVYDFCYYWHHRLGHTVAVLWAAHAVHHQSEEYNLSTALRQTSTGWLFGWIFYLPMAVLGFPPLVFGVVALIDLLYQYWVHTQQIGRLGWFDRWFCAPSNHRVHHAVNDKYLDKNYGGILIVWDRLFGSFIEEDDAEPCVYGTRTPLASWNPLWANLHVYWDIAQDAWHARRWRDKLLVWIKPPGWRPADVAERFPKPAFDLAARRKYDPHRSRAAALVGGGLFLALLGATSAFLWNAHRMSDGAKTGAAAGILLGLWVIGVISERGVGRRPAASGA